MSGIECDSSAFPFVFIRFAPQNATDAEVKALIDEQRRLLGMRRRFVVLIDASRPTSSTSVHRRMYADWLKESEALSKLYCAAMVVVVANPVLRGAMQAVLWLFTPPTPIEIFGNVEEGARRTAELMRKEGLANADVPDRLAKRRVA